MYVSGERIVVALPHVQPTLDMLTLVCLQMSQFVRLSLVHFHEFDASDRRFVFGDVREAVDRQPV